MSCILYRAVIQSADEPKQANCQMHVLQNKSSPRQIDVQSKGAASLQEVASLLAFLRMEPFYH